MRKRASVTDLVAVNRVEKSDADVTSKSATPVTSATPVKATVDTALVLDERQTPPPPPIPTLEDDASYLTAGKSFTARKKVRRE